MRIALIATDLDGTLLRSDRTISPRSRSALQAAQEKGVIVAFVTARPPWAVELLAEQIGVEGVAICCNGAIIYDLMRLEITDKQTFSAEIYRELIVGLRECVPGITFVVQQGDRELRDLHEHQFPPLWDDWVDEPFPRIECALTVKGDGVVKIIAHHPAHSADALRGIVAATVGDCADISLSDPIVIELTPLGISKASGLVVLCARLGIALEQVVAFGDMPNDLPMLSIAGHSVGMANSHPDVLGAVDEVTMSNDEDGVAMVVERLLART